MPKWTRTSPLLLVLVVAGCAGTAKHPSQSGLLRARDLGSSWDQGSGDESPGFDTGCISSAWGQKAPAKYGYTSLVNSASALAGGAPVTIDEYLVFLPDATASATLIDFRTSVPDCNASLNDPQVAPERLVTFASLPKAVVTSQALRLPVTGDTGPAAGAEWTVLLPAPGQGLVWLTVSGGNAEQVERIARASLSAAAKASGKSS